MFPHFELAQPTAQVKVILCNFQGHKRQYRFHLALSGPVPWEAQHGSRTPWANYSTITEAQFSYLRAGRME